MKTTYEIWEDGSDEIELFEADDANLALAVYYELHPEIENGDNTNIQERTIGAKA